MRVALCIGLCIMLNQLKFSQNLVRKLRHQNVMTVDCLLFNMMMMIWRVQDLLKWCTNSLQRHFLSQSNTPPSHFTEPSIPCPYKTTRHLSLFWATSIRSTPSRPSFKVILIWTFYLRLGLLSCLFPSNFPHQTPVCISCIHVRATYPANLNIRIFGEKCIITQILVSKSPPASSCYLAVLTPDTSPLRSWPHVQDQVLHPYKTTKHVLFCMFWFLCTYIANGKTKLNFYRK